MAFMNPIPSGPEEAGFASQYGVGSQSGWNGSPHMPSGQNGGGGQPGGYTGNPVTRTSPSSAAPQIGNSQFLNGTIFGIPTWLVVVGAIVAFYIERGRK